jgi:hypothetical protein
LEGDVIDVRYNGKWVAQYPDQTTADAYVAAKGAGWTAEAPRPVSLSCRGALLGTFADVATANACRDTLIAQSERDLARRPKLALTAGDFTMQGAT